ncbi:MAG: DUF3592 domain-containing protein [Saprospiraceae bacterium]|nr:DUF3592 domain-containing protein [Saprospiraceae bacterium]
MKDKIWLGFCGMFALAGTLFAIIAYNSWRSTYRIIRNGVQTQGLVIENRHKPRKGLEMQTTSLAPVVQFATPDGVIRQYYSQTYTTPAAFQPGETVTLWYLPDDPLQATMDGADAWILPVVFGIFGAALCLIGYPALIGAAFSSLKK